MAKTRQSEINKLKLIKGLRKQALVMNCNAGLLEKVCPEFGHHVELLGAAKITQDWIDVISSELINK